MNLHELKNIRQNAEAMRDAGYPMIRISADRLLTLCAMAEDGHSALLVNEVTQARSG